MAMHIISRVNATFIEERIYARSDRLSRRKAEEGSGRVRLESFNPLVLADERDDGRQIVVAEALYRRHIPEVPVMSPDTNPCGDDECLITVVPRDVDVRKMRWALVCAT
jgi:hypothetical protein